MKRKAILYILLLAACVCGFLVLGGTKIQDVSGRPNMFGAGGVAVPDGQLWFYDTSDNATQINYTGTQVNTAISNALTGAGVSNAVASTASGLKIKDGVSSTTSGAVTVATGLTAVTGVTATLIQDPTTSCCLVTAYKSATVGSIVVKCWGVTNTNDATPILDSASGRSVSWHAFGS